MPSTRLRPRALAAVVAASALAGAGLVAAPARADTTATPTSPTVLAAASYATTTFHDEWDYSNPEDLLIDNSGPTMKVTGASWSGGVLSYTAEPGSYVSPLWGGYPGSLYQNRDGGLAANAITASSYDRISIHAYASADVSSAIQWFDDTHLNSTTEGGYAFKLMAGWHEYDIPLGANAFPNLKVNWAGTIKGIRFATSPTANTTIKLDFMRLYKAGADASAEASWNVTGDPAAPFWSSDGATTCAAPSQTCGPVQDAAGAAVPAATGTVAVDASAYPAGTTLFLASPDGATGIPGSAVTVQPRPQPIVDTPGAVGCGDYATSTFGHPWLASSSTVSVMNAHGVKLSGGKLSATNNNNDPRVYFATGSGIEPSAWRYFSISETYSGAFDLQGTAGGGTMARVFWASGGRPMTQTNDLLTYLDRPTVTVDLGMSPATLLEPDASVRYDWNGTSPVTSLRWDPNEDPGARNWTISNATLGRECATDAAGFAVTWHDPGWVAGTTAVVEAIAGGTTHVLAKATENTGENSARVASALLPLGDYTIRVVATAPRGVSSTATAPTPLRISPAATRVAGSDRYATGVQASKAQFPKGASTVLLASGANYPDALSAAPAAHAVGGALLLTQPNALTPVVAAELKRLKPQHVYLIGGTSAVSAAVAAQVKSATGVTPARVSGADRYATSAAIAAKFFHTAGKPVFAATGAGFPDALSAASAASRLAVPVLLVPGTSAAPTSPVAAQLARLRPSAIYAVGGTAVVSAAMVGRLGRTAPTTRLAGADRYATSAAVGKRFQAGASSSAVLASGLNFPDALVGAALAGARNVPLYLTTPHCVPAGVASELTRITPRSLSLMGGTAVMDAQVADATCA
ncbi:MAG: cell wall-binding repeat-containing protein [Microbacteriaceae bacterium]|nr:cell wall-binding repeat-containing protein [Microbacteriaceae bacterium]MCL2794586.1 cell wall-binding repeat-containing protein [Microbacteriaceae bacterium]